MAKVYDNATDLITFARLQAQNTTSGSSYLGSDGLLKFAAEDEPRIEYGSDGSLKGLLIEEQRTNLVTHSEDFTDASWSGAFSGAPTPTTTVLDPSGGLTAVTLTATSANGQVLRSIGGSAGTGTSYTGSVYIRRRTGSGSVYLFNPNGGGLTAVTVTSQWARYSVTGSGNASTNFIGVRLATAGDEIDIAYAQLEEGSFPTSYIPTAGSTVTRSADIASIPVSAFGYNQEAGTVVVDFATLATFGSRTNNGVFSLRDNSTDVDDLVRLYLASSDNLNAQVRSNNSTVFATGILTDLPEQSETKAAFGFTSGSYAASVDGGAAQSLSTSTTYPVAGEITELAVGEINGNNYLNGHLKSIQYFPRRLTDAQLQELTS